MHALPRSVGPLMKLLLHLEHLSGMYASDLWRTISEYLGCLKCSRTPRGFIQDGVRDRSNNAGALLNPGIVGFPRCTVMFLVFEVKLRRRGRSLNTQSYHGKKTSLRTSF